MFQWMKAASLQGFERRDDVTNGLLMAAQLMIGLGLGFTVNNIGLEPVAALILSGLVIAAKLIACAGWFFEARRMDHCYRREAFLTWLMRAQGAVAFGLGMLVMHIGFSAPTALGFASVIIVAKTLGWMGWRRQALLSGHLRAA